MRRILPVTLATGATLSQPEKAGKPIKAVQANPGYLLIRIGKRNQRNLRCY